MDFILKLLYFIFDIKKLKAKSDKGKKIGWLDVIFPPSLRYAIIIGLILGSLIVILGPTIKMISK